MLDWKRIFPGIHFLIGYDRRWLRTDILAGLTVGAMLVPQSMAYAELAGLSPVHGFYAALLPPIVYAVFGSSRHLGVGPEPGSAVLAAAAVVAVAGSDRQRYDDLMALMALLVSVVAVLAAVLRLGFLAQLLSKPVLVGYISGVGLTLLSSQASKFSGIPVRGEDFFSRVYSLVQQLSRVHGTTLVFASCALLLLLFLKKRFSRWPGALLVVVLGTIVSEVFGLPSRGLRIIGTVAGQLPSIGIPAIHMADVFRLLPAAVGIALVGYTDNVLTARSIAAKHGYAIDANQELAALGAVNFSAALCHGFPVSSSASRTAVPAALGSKSQLVGVIASLFLVSSLLLFSNLLARIPQACLAAVIVSAALAIIDVAGFRSLWRVSKSEFVLALITAGAVMGFDLLSGVLLAVGLSVLLAFARIAVPHDSVLVAVEEHDGWVDAEQYGPGTGVPGLLVYRFDAPLFFANSARFRDRLLLMMERNPGPEAWVVLDFEGVGAVDSTAAEMLEALIEHFRQQQVVLGVARANEVALETLQRAGLVGAEGMTVFPTIKAAVRAFTDWKGSSQREVGSTASSSNTVGDDASHT